MLHRVIECFNITAINRSRLNAPFHGPNWLLVGTVFFLLNLITHKKKHFCCNELNEFFKMFGNFHSFIMWFLGETLCSKEMYVNYLRQKYHVNYFRIIDLLCLQKNLINSRQPIKESSSWLMFTFGCRNRPPEFHVN